MAAPAPFGEVGVLQRKEVERARKLEEKRSEKWRKTITGTSTFLHPRRTPLSYWGTESCQETVCLLPSAHTKASCGCPSGAPLVSEPSRHSRACSDALRGYFGLDGIHGGDCRAWAAYPVLLFSILFSLSFSSLPYNYSNKEKRRKKKGRRTCLHLIFSTQINGGNLFCISIGTLHIKIFQNKA